MSEIGIETFNEIKLHFVHPLVLKILQNLMKKGYFKKGKSREIKLSTILSDQEIEDFINDTFDVLSDNSTAVH
jgi:hypothetical protein